jgi:LCP family protein required for cell wall assembly
VTSQKTSEEEKHHPTTSKYLSRLWIGLAMSGLAMTSAVVGGLLAVSVSSKPLMQQNLTPREEAVFDTNRISEQGLKFPDLVRPVNVLVMGMSVLSTDTKNPLYNNKDYGYLPQVNSFDGLSDVILLVRLDPQQKKIVILSIPRDTSVNIDGDKIDKINAANYKGGPALAAQTVSKLLSGVTIDRYVRINVLGVSKLIDALGGVTVNVPKDMKYQDDSQHLYINLKAGEQHLNGDQALQLLRYRNDGLGDIGRIERQQMVIRALMSQTLNLATVRRLPKILNIVQSHIDTNLTVEELVALAGFGVQTQSSNIETLMIPGRPSEKREYKNTSYWIPDNNGIAVIMTQHFGIEPVDILQADQTNLQVEIQDSTQSDSFILQGVIETIQQAGYYNIFISESTTEPLSVTLIIATRENRETAEAIRNALGFGEVRVESSIEPNSNITIVLGKDWLMQQNNDSIPYQLYFDQKTRASPWL